MKNSVEQKFISDFQRGRTPTEAGTGAKRQAGKRNREQITVEQKFISDFQRSRTPPEAGTGAKDGPAGGTGNR